MNKGSNQDTSARDLHWLNDMALALVTPRIQSLLLIVLECRLLSLILYRNTDEQRPLTRSSSEYLKKKSHVELKKEKSMVEPYGLDMNRWYNHFKCAPVEGLGTWSKAEKDTDPLSEGMKTGLSEVNKPNI